MEIEQVEIFEHLRRHPPFSLLSDECVEAVAGDVEVTYFRAGSSILSLGDEVKDLYFIRSGSVEIYRRDGELYNRLGEGEIFGQLALMTGKKARFPVQALEDTLIYFIPEERFFRAFEEEEAFADFVEVEDRTRMRQAWTSRQQANLLMTTRVERLVHRGPILVSADMPVQVAAARQVEEGVSALMITASREEGSTQPGHPELVGILTHSDLARRVVAEGLDLQTPVGEVMSTDVASVQRDSFLFEALMVMLQKNIHHLPVLDRMQPVGMIDLADVVGHETQNSLFVVRNIFLKDSVEGLKSLWPDVEGCFVRMVNEDANSHMIGSAISVIGRSFKQRLIELAESQLGEAPVPFCLLALGSMARDEQFLNSDQDNALILSDDFDPDQHGDYFEALAHFVCDGLAEIGYRYCSGDIMATNPKWRQPLHVWKKTFAEWIGKPRPEALLNSSIFFDLDGAAGDTRMADELRSEVVRQAAQSREFLGCMAANAQSRTPPLGFFKDFVLEKSGKYERTLNLKGRGTAPLVDVIRVHALAAGSQARNSFSRLEDVHAAGFLTSGMADDLRDALEFIAIIRARRQAIAVEEGRRPNNHVDPDLLSTLDRRSLKDAFKVLSTAQNFLKFRYRP
jgi:CBS domain-containing protein